MKEIPSEWIGGKEDDVTVAIAQIFSIDKHPRSDSCWSLAERDTYCSETKKVYTELLTPRT